MQYPTPHSRLHACSRTLFVLDLGLDILNGVRRLHLKGDSLARQGLHENLHSKSSVMRDGVVLDWRAGPGLGAWVEGLVHGWEHTGTAAIASLSSLPASLRSTPTTEREAGGRRELGLARG